MRTLIMHFKNSSSHRNYFFLSTRNCRSSPVSPSVLTFLTCKSSWGHVLFIGKPNKHVRKASPMWGSLAHYSLNLLSPYLRNPLEAVTLGWMRLYCQFIKRFLFSYEAGRWLGLNQAILHLSRKDENFTYPTYKLRKTGWTHWQQLVLLSSV